MTKFLAIIRAGSDKVVSVTAVELNRVVSEAKSSGSIVIGEYSNQRHAERAVELGLKGWRRCPDARKTGT
jgi:hypothetical protein